MPKRQQKPEHRTHTGEAEEKSRNILGIQFTAMSISQNKNNIGPNPGFPYIEPEQSVDALSTNLIFHLVSNAKVIFRKM